MTAPLEASEWERRFKAHIVQRLTGVNEPLADWTIEQATNAANAEFEAVDTGELMDGFENDPEGSADECLSYWGDGA